jgi:hypothetical protein
MLLASKAGGYMDNAVLAVDGGRNMVNLHLLLCISGVERDNMGLGNGGDALMIRWLESTMEYLSPRKRTSRFRTNLANIECRNQAATGDKNGSKWKKT